VPLPRSSCGGGFVYEGWPKGERYVRREARVAA
jgi:hypothetical protein